MLKIVWRKRMEAASYRIKEKERLRARYLAHSEEHKAIAKAWRLANPEKCRAARMHGDA